MSSEATCEEIGTIASEMLAYQQCVSGIRMEVMQGAITEEMLVRLASWAKSLLSSEVDPDLCLTFGLYIPTNPEDAKVLGARVDMGEIDGEWREVWNAHEARAIAAELLRWADRCDVEVARLCGGP